MHKFNSIISVLFFLLLLLSCQDNTEKRYTIGFSQCMMDDVWRQAMMVEMNIEVSNYENIDIIVMDAEENNQKQIRQIRELINRKVDVLIISPNESNNLTPIAVEAYRAGIPTIIADRKINSDEYTSYVGGDSYEIGKMAGQYASSLLPDSATILEIWGTKTTSPAIERHQGFIDGLDKSKGFNIISIEGKWRREIARDETEKLPDYENIDLVYAHNDVMAIGAREAIIKRDSSLIPKIKIMGVDGAFGKDAGLEAVADGRIDASFLYPTGGDEVIKVAMKILTGQPVEKQYILEGTRIIDKPTAQTLLLQSDQLINYQNRIEQQRKNLESIVNEFSILRHSLILILLLAGLLFLFSIYIFYINRKIKRRNSQLRLKNDEIEHQKQQLIILNEKIKEVNDQKVRFFMNVSHEVRTPLTLIVSPLEKWIKNVQDPALLADLTRMKKNTDRLTRIINQLLDFQKIESDKTQLNVSNKDIVSFTSTVKSLFDELAETRNIHYSFTSNKPSAQLWFDADKMEKILVNLLSNAFKFTHDNGTIAVDMHCYNEKISISVSDNGTGISKDKLPLVFDRFYTDSSDNKTGTGIGLHLTQEFVKMHGGKISVESDPGKKTVFTIEIPAGKHHLPEYSLMENQNEILESGAESIIDAEKTREITGRKYNYTVLIVEDDQGIREYLSEELSENFHVLTAENGLEALQLMEKQTNITLVLSDVLMPWMNGFELCKKIKASPVLSDIPVILLTALGEIDQRMYGIAEGADDYIRKPFHIDYVKVKIIRLLEERRRLQRKFMQTMQTGGIPIIENDKKIDSSDEIFISQFISLLETSYAKTDISVEKLSEELNISRVHLYRKIKEISGLTPVDYLRNFRLSKAVELLDKRRFSVSEVAYQTGFSSPAYFSKCFKDVFGMTPSEYMEKK
ncbi:hybrid sensor histidine kinase/response regulator transcription factor [Proteiniphilum acetatigenes]|uniref:hybrid sensor histidine kinase/response regulator transcription factor n=1 Tax=Proteiniphilum acetatigenes TaxID=294710 RepID=UPI000399D7A6|nr:substrate-binding domain-containing protein [Proteiniphilum acetatigenes]SFL28483.1 ABC-type sugar transport system, substrate-binding protein, contains N-terminal xre family HTH domain [Porphyromonadaceae bacterium KH3CP3RA]